MKKNTILGDARDSNKRFRLTYSEIDNAETSYGGGLKYTIIRRMQPCGKYLIAAIDLDTRAMIDGEVAENISDCPRAVHEVNRWLDKRGVGGKMSSVSRHRATVKKR